MTHRSRRALPAAAVCLYLALAVVMFSSAWTAGPHHTVGVAGDPQAEMWYLEWVRFAIRHALNPLLSDHLGYPAGVSLMWNNANAVPLLGLLLSPVSAVFGADSSVNISSTLGPALSAAAAMFACRRYATRGWPAIVGGLLYGFSPYMVAQSLGHFGLTFAAIPPLMLIVLDALLVGQSLGPVKLGVLLGILAAAQLLIAEELLAGEGVAAAVGIGVLAVVGRRQVAGRLRRAAAGLGIAGLTFAVLGAVPLGIQFLGPGVVEGQIRPPDVFVTDLLNFVVPTSVQLLHSDWTDSITAGFTGGPAEWNGYIGLPLIAVLAAAMIRLRRNPLVQVLGSAALVMAALSLGPHLHVGGRTTRVPLPWQVDGVPLLSQLLPSRLMLFFFLFAAIVLARYVDELVALPEAPRGLRRAGGLVLLGLAGLSLLPQWPWPSTPTEVPAFFTSSQLSQIPEGSVALVAPFSRYTSEPMVWQAAGHMRFRNLGGNFISADGPAYQGPAPRPITRVMEAIEAGAAPPGIDANLRRSLTDDFVALDIQSVVVAPMDHRAEMLIFFRDLYQRPPRQEGGVQLWRGLPPG